MTLIAKTTCPYCGVGCGIDVFRDVDGIRVAGDKSHPANRGQLCIKGTTLVETLDAPERLTSPRVDGQATTWPVATGAVAERIRQTIAQYGPESVAFYLSGQLLTEDYYVANKLIKGFIGSPHVDTNSRLCMASAVAAQKRAFGEDVVPGNYKDLELADVVVLVGSNAAWTHPVLFQRMLQAREQNLDKNPDKKIIVIDPRRTDTAEMADLFLQIRPGTDAYLYSALFRYLHERGAMSSLELLKPQFQETLDACPTATMAEVASYCGVSESVLRSFFLLFSRNERVVTFYSQGINQSRTGTDNANAIINCHVASGRFGRPGATAFSVTGQPNAMGGREVGGLATQLAAHMDFDDPADIDRVRRFWHAPNLVSRGGHRAIDMFKAIERGEIRFLWVMATNPLVSMPEASRWERALQRCDTVVVSDCVANTDTLRLADIQLPAAGWGEKDGTVTNSERMISRQRAFLPPLGEARPDWWIVTRVAHELGYGEMFDYGSPHDIFVEHAALSAFENNGARHFNLVGLKSLSQSEYETLAPVRWPVLDDRQGTERVDVAASVVPVQPTEEKSGKGYVLNTGRLRDQWHTMTRTAISRTLLQSSLEPCVEIHPDDALELSVADGALVELENDGASNLFRVRVSDAVATGSVFAPIHFSRTNARRSRVDDVVAARHDPVSGQPALKHARVRVRRCDVTHYHMGLTAGPVDMGGCHYWVQHRLANCYLSIGANVEPDAIRRELTHRHGAPVQIYSDPANGDERWSFAEDDRLAAVWFSSAMPLSESPWWLADQMGAVLSEADWQGVLFGRPPGIAKRGNMICSCFQVTDAEIRTAIAAGAESVAALGQTLKCGTNCGSCVPQISRLLADRSCLVS